MKETEFHLYHYCRWLGLHRGIPHRVQEYCFCIKPLSQPRNESLLSILLYNLSPQEESLLKIREEEERRKETQTKFQNTLSEITNMLQQNNEKNAKLRDDNITMSEKFKSVVQQYQLREQQVNEIFFA